MLIESSCLFAATVEAGYDLAIHVYHLALRIYSEAGARIVDEWRSPGSIEWGSLYLVLGCGFAEIRVRAGIHKGVVSGHRRLQGSAIHRSCLISVLDGGGEIRERVRAEEPAVGIDVRRRDLPPLPCHCVRVEDCPYRTGRVVRRSRSRIHRRGGIEEIIPACIIFDIGGIEVTAWGIRADVVIPVSSRVITFRLIIESLTHLVYEDYVLPIPDTKAGSADEREYGAGQLPREIIVLTANRSLSSNSIAVFESLVRQTPERCPDCHGCELSAGILKGIGFTGNLVHLGQPGVEHSAEVHIAGTAACGDDDAPGRTDVHARLGTANVAVGEVAL